MVSDIQTSKLLRHSLLLLQPHNSDLLGRIGQVTKKQHKTRLPSLGVAVAPEAAAVWSAFSSLLSVFSSHI